MSGKLALNCTDLDPRIAMKAARKKVTRTDFRAIVAEEVTNRFGSLGFKEHDAGAFGRAHTGFIQGFGVTPDSSLMKFCVSVGVLIPALWVKEDYLLGIHAPGFKISHRLGEFRNSFTGIDTWYHFYTSTELRSCFDTVRDDFMAQAVPWLERLRNLDDVVAEYYRYRIGPLSSGDERPPNPFAWASYGWMLELIGQPGVAREWLVRAREHLVRQSDGGLCSPEEQRLIQLLATSP